MPWHSLTRFGRLLFRCRHERTRCSQKQEINADRQYPKDGNLRILSLDGGGSKGLYTLGVLREIEGMLKCPLYKCFDLVFGTSTGAIIAALIALGYEVDDIHNLYKAHVPKVMKPWLRGQRLPRWRSWLQDAWGEKVHGRKNRRRHRCDKMGHRAANDFQGVAARRMAALARSSLDSA